MYALQLFAEFFFFIFSEKIKALLNRPFVLPYVIAKTLATPIVHKENTHLKN